MYRSFGFRPRPIALSILVTGLWNVFLKLSLPVVAVTASCSAVRRRGGLVAASGVGIAVLLVAVARVHRDPSQRGRRATGR